MKNKLMTIAVLLTVMMAMTGIAAAVDEETDPVRFLGQITDENGIGIPNIPVQITKEFIIMGIHFTVKWEDTTDANGNYETPYNAYFLEFLRSGHYKLFLNGNLAGEKDLVNADFTFDKKEWIDFLFINSRSNHMRFKHCLFFKFWNNISPTNTLCNQR